MIDDFLPEDLLVAVLDTESIEVPVKYYVDVFTDNNIAWELYELFSPYQAIIEMGVSSTLPQVPIMKCEHVTKQNMKLIEHIGRYAQLSQNMESLT